MRSFVKAEEEEEPAEDIQTLLDPFLFCESDEMLAYPVPDLVQEMQQPCMPAACHHEEWAVPAVPQVDCTQSIMYDFPALPFFAGEDDDFLEVLL